MRVTLLAALLLWLSYGVNALFVLLFIIPFQFRSEKLWFPTFGEIVRLCVVCNSKDNRIIANHTIGVIRFEQVVFVS